MAFIGRHATSAEFGGNVITDGRDTCAYGELPAVFSDLGAQLAEVGASRDVCVAFECDNSLPSALTLLFLLESGYSFVLMPARKPGSETPAFDIPGFCAHHVVAARGAGEVVSVRLTIAPDPAYQAGRWQPDGPRMYIPTSGSTGAPKLAVYSHEGLWQNGFNLVQRLHWRSTDRVAVPVRVPHMYGLGAVVLPAAGVGASMDLQMGNVIDFMSRERTFEPNRVFLTPTFCESLLKGRRSTRPYEVTVTGGDRLRPETFVAYEERFGTLVQMYGSTEMGAIAAGSPDDPAEARVETVGRPLPEVEIRLGEPSPADGPGGGPERAEDIGELWCRYPHGFAGYADERGAVREPPGAAHGGWFPMRDICQVGSDGRLRVRGRADHAVKRAGYLVMLGDLEASILAVPAVDGVAVVAHGESDYGTGLVAFCTPTKGEALDAEEVRRACLERLPPRSVPDRFVVLPELPVLASGKVDRQALLAMAAGDTETPAGSGAPAGSGG